MLRMISGLFFSIAISVLVYADNITQPTVHPCTGEAIPLVTEKAVVQAIECLYPGRVAKVKQVTVESGAWYYRFRLLMTDGRIKTIDVHPETGLPLDPNELEAVYETLNR